MKKNTNHLLTGMAALALMGAYGCGSDEPPVDACGHACPDSPINLPEGGEVRIELVHNLDSATEARTSGWFLTDQVPAARPWPRPPAVWNTNGADQCTDISNGEFFPKGNPMSRTYRDVGERLKLISPSAEISLAKRLNVQDFALDTKHDIVYMDDVDITKLPPATDFGVDLDNGTNLGDLYLPADYNVTFPNMDEYIEMPRNTDFPFTWEVKPSDDPFMFSFVVFSDQWGPLFFCIGPNTGVMKVPAAVVNQLPPTGIVSQGVVNHRVKNMDGRRLDLIGINCHATLYHVDVGGL